jgi:probable F420-dependent oxidoreductase
MMDGERVASAQRPRPFRFGAGIGGFETRRSIVTIAQRLEDWGFATALTSDHVGAKSPFLPLLVAAEATERLRFGTLVLNTSFYNPALLARDAATMDILTEGRFELGLGAGYKHSEYDAIGIPYESGAQRVAKLGSTVRIVKRLLSGEPVTADQVHDVRIDRLEPRPLQTPRPPILVAGRGPALMRLAAREADIVALIGASYSPHATTRQHRGARSALIAEGGLVGDGWAPEDVAKQVTVLQEAAPERFDALELQALVWDVVVTDRPRAAAEDYAAKGHVRVEPDVAERSPFLLYGSVAGMVEQLQERRERFGISYYSTSPHLVERFAPVVGELAGT